MNNLTKGLSRFHLLYCAALSLLISVAGIVTNNGSGGYFFQLLFLPVTLFFIFTFATSIKRRGKSSGYGSHLRGSKVFFIIVFLLFFFLIALSLFHVVDLQKSSSGGTIQDKTGRLR